VKNLFVTGIGTDVGKTVVSAILVKALSALYWKPVQAGSSDEDTVRTLSGIESTRLIAPVYNLSTPCSPHQAAAIDGVKVKLAELTLPRRSERIIVEGAGGLLVPLNESDLIIDLVRFLSLPVVLVSRQYLGSINHTLLTLAALRAYKIEVLGVVFVGDRNLESEKAILSFGQTRCLFHLPLLEPLSKESIESFVEKKRDIINERFSFQG